MEEDMLEDLKDFQTPSSLDPALLRIIKENMGVEFLRDRSKSVSKSAREKKKEQMMRDRSSSFSHLQSPKFKRKSSLVNDLLSGVKGEWEGDSMRASLCGDCPANLSQFYEVLLLGKIKVSHKRAPPSFIDEAVKKIQDRDTAVTAAASSLSNHTLQVNCHAAAQHPLANAQLASLQPTPPAAQHQQLAEVVLAVTPQKSAQPPQPGANRTMLLQVGKLELRLISPDQKQVLIQKSFREISHCSCGIQNKENFGFICKEMGKEAPGYVGYIFQCENSSVVEDILQGLRSAFISAHEAARKERAEQQCSHCPMVWFNHLCTDLDGLSASKAQSVLLRRVEHLPGGEGEGILAKMQGAETPDIDEQNQILMMLLKASCEVRQQSHVHTPGLILCEKAPTQESALTEAAKKAKRSLAESFNGIIRRKASIDVEGSLLPNSGTAEKNGEHKQPPRLYVEGGAPSSPECGGRGGGPPHSPLQPLTPREHVNFHCELASPGDTRQRSRTVGSAGGETMKRELARRRLQRLQTETVPEEEGEGTSTSPMISIFKKTGLKSPHPPQDRAASMQHIYKKVVTPVKKKLTEVQQSKARNYRELWQNAIKQQILLDRMERENRRIIESEELLALKRVRADYEDLVVMSADLQKRWETLLATGPRCRRSELRELMGEGVWKGWRGDVWSLVLAQAGERTPPPTEQLSAQFDKWEQPYSQLKSQLTPHQHAILIDLGRTFPNHGYFSGALGPGQLAMFNLLKAYSILDSEVGYCQGLPFLVGLLLMHHEEEEAFLLLKYLMFQLGLRNQFKPDMTGLQVAMYQLTRLLAETIPPLYKLFDRIEVDPSLYATPWFLTLFAAHFPLGFVARVLDLILLEGANAIIKVGVCLLVSCSSSLLACDSLEEIMNIIRTDLPATSPAGLEDVIKQAASLNISRQLKTYEVEYAVIQEEMNLREIARDETAADLRAQNEELKKENISLKVSLEAAERSLEQEREHRRTLEEELDKERMETEELLAKERMEKEELLSKERMEKDELAIKKRENEELLAKERSKKEELLAALTLYHTQLPPDIRRFLVVDDNKTEINGNIRS